MDKTEKKRQKDPDDLNGVDIVSPATDATTKVEARKGPENDEWEEVKGASRG